MRDYFKEMSISMNEFMHSYCGMSRKLNFSHAKHRNVNDEELQKVNPEIGHVIIRYSFDYIKSRIEKIETGEVIIVRDAEHKLAPYANPRHLSIKQLLVANLNIIKEELEKNEAEYESGNCPKIIINEPKKKIKKKRRERIKW